MSDKKRSLITGAFGQDAQLLADLLNKKGEEVWLTDRRRSRQEPTRYYMVRMDLMDRESIKQALLEVKPDCIYHLAAQSHVGWSFEVPEQTILTNTLGTLHILETIRTELPYTRMYFAATSEMFGGAPKTRQDIICNTHNCYVKTCPSADELVEYSCPLSGMNDIECNWDNWEEVEIPVAQNEDTPFYPRSPYGVSKLAAYWLVRNYRESYNLKCCSGILFNHESALRGDEFLPKKVCNYVKMYKRWKDDGIILGNPRPLRIGNIFAKRDWGWAKEYVEGMYRILHQDTYWQRRPYPLYTIGNEPDPETLPKRFGGFKDYVLGTGSTITVGEFVKRAFQIAGFEGEWKYVNSENRSEYIDRPFEQTGPLLDTEWKFVIDDVQVVEIDPQFYRPAEVHTLLADASLVERELGWKPSPDSVDLIIKDMLDE